MLSLNVERACVCTTLRRVKNFSRSFKNYVFDVNYSILFSLVYKFRGVLNMTNVKER